jgi:hypothetical protein
VAAACPSGRVHQDQQGSKQWRFGVPIIYLHHCIDYSYAHTDTHGSALAAGFLSFTASWQQRQAMNGLGAEVAEAFPACSTLWCGKEDDARAADMAAIYLVKVVNPSLPVPHRQIHSKNA